MFTAPRCEVLPLPGEQVSLRINGRECTRWNFSDQAPRPFFYPLNGPDSGVSLTRMGHPGAQNHDHHLSVWFAHHKLLGIDFWGYGTQARTRQLMWLVYEDGDEATLAVRLGWFDGHNPSPLVEQELIASLIPWEEGEYILDLQSTFVPIADQIEFQQTNFGFLGVRVARSLSAHFGGGQLTNDSGAVGESAIFGQPARWVDYSGPSVVYREISKEGTGDPGTVWEGITYLDHPLHPGPMRKWHVRDDGWMCCSPCMDAPLITTSTAPLTLRYALYIHRGGVNPERISQVLAHWGARPWRKVVSSQQPHRQFELVSL